MTRKLYYDVVIAGCGVAGLYTALSLPHDRKILMLSKEDLASCDSMLAQGGICVLRDENDFDAYFEDTMRAGHYENRVESVEIMIPAVTSSRICSHWVSVLRKMRTEVLPTHGKGRTQNRGFVFTRISQARKSQRHCCHMYKNLTM